MCVVVTKNGPALLMLEYPDIEEFQSVPLHTKGKLKKHAYTCLLCKKLKQNSIIHFLWTHMQRKALRRLGERRECRVFWNMGPTGLEGALHTQGWQP